MRLNQFLASAGLGSRRSCEELILGGQVRINGVQCTVLATKVEPTDVVKVGNRVVHSAAPVTILLHKPPGFICTASDTDDRRTVFDLLPPNFPRVFHVGRLDRESEGLLILTNDGALSLKLTHPRYKVEKEYEVVLDKPFDFELSDKMIHGMHTQEGWAKAESVHRLGGNKVKVILRQGLKRQIRVMFYELGYEVQKLVRTRIGTIRIQGLPPGAWRALTQKELETLLTRAEPTGDEPTERHQSHRTPHSQDRGGMRRPARPARPSRPARPTEGAPRNAEGGESQQRSFSKRPQQGRVEEIPFTPRAARPGASAPQRDERPGERPRRAPHSGRPGSKFGAKSGGKSFSKKPGKSFGQKSKSGGKPSGEKSAPKAGPHPFAKFHRQD